MENAATLDATPLAPVESWEAVGQFPSLAEAYDHGLVILAMGEACRVTAAEAAGTYELQAETVATPKIFPELQAYQLESQPPAPSLEGFRHAAGIGLSLAWVLLLGFCYYLQGTHPVWEAKLVSSSRGLIAEGQWWRPFTALFLHGDLSHLMGNLVTGVIFGTLVSRWIGSWRAWSLTLLCGSLGNAMTSWLTYPAEFISLGASTAVFAAVGILSGLGVAETIRARLRLSWIKVATPFLAGLVILGMMGGNHSSQTDVLGHVFGFGTGVVAGWAVAHTESAV